MIKFIYTKSLLLLLCLQFMTLTYLFSAPVLVMEPTVKVDDTYRTKAWVDIESNAIPVQRILTDLQHYNDWALYNLKNKKSTHKKLHIHLTDMKWIGSKKNMEITYNMNLPWPLKKKGLKTWMNTRIIHNKKNLIIEMKPDKRSFFLKEALYKIICENHGTFSRLEVNAYARLHPVIVPFFSAKMYDREIQTYIKQILKNLIAELEIK